MRPARPGAHRAAPAQRRPMRHHEEETSMDKRGFLRAGAIGLGALAGGPALAADAWPSKTVRFVVPFAAGGSSDVVARSVAAELSKTLGHSVYVENKPGGAGKGRVASRGSGRSTSRPEAGATPSQTPSTPAAGRAAPRSRR